jgi:hypothetical protein
VFTPVLVGLVGRAQVGKDTLAADWIERFGFVRVSFAEPLRKMAEALNPYVTAGAGILSDGTHIPRALRYREALGLLGYETAKRELPEFRGILQRLGTEAGRQVHGEDVWVDLAIAEAQEAVAIRRTPVVFTDVRFPNEADAIRRAGGRLVRIHRPDAPSAGSHASEMALASIETHAVIENTGSVVELHEAGETVLRAYFPEAGPWSS